MSEVSKYVETLVTHTEGLLEDDLSDVQTKKRMISLHERLRSTLKSDVLSGEERERLTAVSHRLLTEGFQIDLPS